MKQIYKKPTMTKLDNLKEITFDCPEFSCSITVPPEPDPT